MTARTQRRPVRLSLAGSAPVLICVATAIVYLIGMGRDGAIATSPRGLLFITWLSGIAALGIVALLPGSAMRQAIAGLVAGVGMLAGGAAGLMTIGLPLAVAGVVEIFSVASIVEDAAAGARRGWLLLALAALGTLVAFAVGVAITPV